MGNPKGLTESGSGELGIIVCGRVLWLYQYWPCGVMLLWFFVQELLEAQPAVVLVLKRLRRGGKWLEVSSDRLGELGIFNCRVPWLYQYWPGGFVFTVVLCPGTPEGSTGSGSGFKASQKTGQRLKVSSDRLGGWCFTRTRN